MEVTKSRSKSEWTRRWRINNPEKVKAWLEKNRERINAQARERRRRDPEKFLITKRAFYAKHKERLSLKEREMRREVIDHYGGACVCCGEREFGFLALDHINGGGAKHRREIGNKRMYQWAKKNNYPDILQVLCHNCNQAKHIYGKCPHEK